jgi:hypothetical protein
MPETCAIKVARPKFIDNLKTYLLRIAIKPMDFSKVAIDDLAFLGSKCPNDFSSPPNKVFLNWF